MWFEPRSLPAHLSPHGQVLPELLAGQSSVAISTGSGETLPSPCSPNRSDETLLRLIFSPLAVVTGLEPANPFCQVQSFLSLARGRVCSCLIFLNASFCVGEYSAAVPPFASQTALTDHSSSRYGATQRKGKSPASSAHWLGGECLDLTSLAPQ